VRWNLVLDEPTERRVASYEHLDRLVIMTMIIMRAWGRGRARCICTANLARKKQLAKYSLMFHSLLSPETNLESGVACCSLEYINDDL